MRDITDDEERAIAAFMRRVAAEVVAEHRQLPDLYVLWWKAELLRRWEAERRASAPLDIVEPAQWAAGLVAAGLALAWVLPSLLRIVMF